MEFIYQLEALVWDAYEDQLSELVGPDPPESPEQYEDSDDLADDDIPF